jgi:hypothetical protein
VKEEVEKVNVLLGVSDIASPKFFFFNSGLRGYWH